MLVRKLIGKRLANYYSQPSSKVVGSAQSGVDLRSLLGEWHWKRLYQRLYQEQEGQWLTPVELFQPHFSNILGNFIIEAARQDDSAAVASERIEIVELGGGRGTNAGLILNYLEETAPDLYERLSYTIIDNSESLIELQKDSISKQQRHVSKVDFHRKDLMDIAEKKITLLPPLLSSQSTTTVVLALELFDNLPHDKIRVRVGGHAIEQVQVEENELGELDEVFVPLSDPLLKHVIQSAPTYTRRGSGSPIAWIPTVACGILHQLVVERPDASLLVADFDWLPPPDLVTHDKERRSNFGQGEPLVTDMNDIDHECYLQSPELCDILFPTDFSRLASYVQKTWNTPRTTTGSDTAQTVSVQKQADFLAATGPDIVEKTKSWVTGYTPLLNDFANCSVLTVKNKRKPTIKQ